jgi:hypothetical protein
MYSAAIAAQQVPNFNYPLGCTLTADAMTGATTIQVSTPGGNALDTYSAGDTIGTWSYLPTTPTLVPPPFPPGTPATPSYPAQQVTFTVASVVDATHITITPAVPASYGGKMPSGTQFGFTGTVLQWNAQILPALIKTRTSTAAIAEAYAGAIVAHITSNAALNGNADISTSLGGLQSVSSVATNPPLTAKTIPLVGGIT